MITINYNYHYILFIERLLSLCALTCSFCRTLSGVPPFAKPGGGVPGGGHHGMRHLAHGRGGGLQMQASKSAGARHSVSKTRNIIFVGFFVFFLILYM